jgi:CheY-like chemotaxis protein/two-component sensor histidine kinase
VNDLLDLARVEAGKTVVSAKEFNVADLFGALRGMLRPLLVGDAVNLSFEDAGDIPALFTDEGKVSQILRNFISNALKFTDKGEVRVWAEYDRLAGSITFRVRDTGVGIAAEHIDTVWKEFEQVPNRLQAGVKGTGLGLPLARNLAALLGGAVDVQSAVGEGSVFSVTIPVRYAQAEGIGQMIWQLDPERLPVLVVEDNAADAFSIERIVADSQYQVMVAHNVAEAKRALEQFTPAAVLLDVMLQNEESWRVLIEMRQNDKTHHIPVIVLSTTNEERKARHFGANEYFDKPVEREDLLRCLNDLTTSRIPVKLLLVDDEEISRYLIRQLLPVGDFNVSEAHSVSDGLVRAETDLPDLLLVDLNMPQLDGYEMLNRLKASEKLRDVPVIIVTSMLVDENVRTRLRAATEIVSKFDLTSEVLVQAIRTSIEKNKARAA